MGFLGIPATEFVIGGLPDTLIHALSYERGWRGTVPTLNALTPWIYSAARIGTVYFLINVCLKRAELGRQPLQIMRLLDRDLASKLQ